MVHITITTMLHKYRIHARTLCQLVYDDAVNSLAYSNGTRHPATQPIALYNECPKLVTHTFNCRHT